MKLVVRILSTCLLITLISCIKSKDDGLSYMDPVSESAIQGYLRKINDSTAIKDRSGVYYTILKQGDGVNFCRSNNIPSIIYTSKLLDGQTIGSSFTPTDFDHRELKNHIPGWQIGLSKISVGGKIRLYIPPELAYGNVGITGVIPPNAILISEIELVSIED